MESTFINRVLVHLPAVLDPTFRPQVMRHLQGMYRDKWTVEDAVSFFSCFEEVSPDLDEATACARMVELQMKYAG